MTTKKKPAPTARQAPMIHVGTSVDAVREARGAINDILNARDADNTTKQEALRTLATLCNTNNTTIQNCHLQG